MMEATGALAAWQELSEYTDRTSPAEYPDMCLITFEELRMFMAQANTTGCLCGEVAGESPDCPVHVFGEGDEKNGARKQGLKVEIVDGRLIVSIGVDALMTAVKGGPTWSDQEDEERGWKITSADGFAEDIADELLDEEEDGTTLIHVALDAAIERAVDQGSLNIDFGKDA